MSTEMIWDADGRPWRIVNPVMCHRETKVKGENGRMKTVDCSYMIGSLEAIPDGEWTPSKFIGKNDV